MAVRSESSGCEAAWAAAAAPDASNALESCVAAVPSPRFVRAVEADARSDRLFAFRAASASAAIARAASVATLPAGSNADVADVAADPNPNAVRPAAASASASSARPNGVVDNAAIAVRSLSSGCELAATAAAAPATSAPTSDASRTTMPVAPFTDATAPPPELGNEVDKRSPPFRGQAYKSRKVRLRSGERARRCCLLARRGPECHLGERKARRRRRERDTQLAWPRPRERQSA